MTGEPAREPAPGAVSDRVPALERQLAESRASEEALRRRLDGATAVMEADHAATAMQNAQLLSDLRTHQARLEALLEISQELARLQPVDSLLSRVTEACAHLLGADVGFRLVEGDALVLRAQWGEAVAGPIRVGESLTGLVAASGELVLSDDLAGDPRITPPLRSWLLQNGYRYYVGIPVKIAGRVVGVLSGATRGTVPISTGDVVVATAFAAQAATALENARLYEEASRAYTELARTQDRLAHAQRMEALGRLAGGIAHDFNNLLAVIMGYSELMTTALPADEGTRKAAGEIRKASTRAAALTRQLLALGRRQVLEARVLDLNALLLPLTTMLQRVIGEDIVLTAELQPDLGRVRADPGQLEQVIMNLAINARDAMPAGGALRLETVNLDLPVEATGPRLGLRPGRYVRLQVTDTGMGMDAETQTHIFEPFFTTKGPGKGSGLGLATAYGIVKQSGGELWAESEPGRGTIFTLLFPRVDAAAEPGAAAAPGVSPRGSETVLLVEDEAAVRRLVRDLLATMGYRVLDAANGADALATCARHDGRIALLLTDVVMPGMNGWELATRLSADRPELRVLFMSGYAADVIGRPLGGADPPLLTKPFTPETLGRKVREVLDGPLLRMT